MQTDKTVYQSHLTDSTHILGKITNEYCGTGHVTLHIQGAMVRAYAVWLPDDEVTLLYYKHSLGVGTTTRPLTFSTLNWHVSRYGYYPFTGALNAACVLANLSLYDSKLGREGSLSVVEKRLQMNNSAFDGPGFLKALSQQPIPDFAADYHVNVEVDDIAELVLENWAVIRRTLDLPKMLKLGRVSVITCILWALCVSEHYRDVFKLAGLGECDSHKDFIKIGKEVSNVAKHLHNVVDADLRPLFEIHNLINRVDTKIDWGEEYANRVFPNTVKVDPSWVRVQCRRMFARVSGYDHSLYRTEDWDSFWNRRFEWTPVGSDFSQYDRDQQYRDPESEWRNKLVTVCNMPSGLPLQYFTDRVPSCYAKTSIKYEWSKTRAIYGCDLTNFILHTFVYGKCEEALSANFACGSQSSDMLVARKIDALLLNRTPLCLDYEDFNSQHSTESMLAVLQAFGDVFGPRMSQDQLSAYHWTLKAIRNQWVYGGQGTSEPYKVNGTLFSGWKLTTFVNSCLNYCYYKLMFPMARLDSHIHAGDDVISYITDGKEYLEAIANARYYNIRLSKAKCHLASVAEFLRVDHRSGDCGQYLCRALTTLTMGRIETSPSFSLVELSKSYLTRAASALARGARDEVINRVSWNALSRRISPASKHVPLDILLDTSTICGGLSESKESSLEYEVSILPTWFEAAGRSLNQVKSIPGLIDYGKVIKRALSKYNVRLPKLMDSLASSFCKMFVKVPQKLEIRELSLPERARRAVWREFKGYFSEVKGYGKVGLARLAGCLPSVLVDPQFARLAHFFSRPEECFKAISVIL
nr:MAG: RNA-dependent RNA polymerase [Totiviridae sp.]